ncbi:VOC family protein [Actinomycetospora chibensis]|uniref:VOC family protein n=1 Tax=Actinomycetospora chibensis TaxID=663606 RepID=A0ABV9RL72_9PSEU|nr:VOC family protein [Actinomycetospora chibensis]MDD7923423.1 VOC family protein [Actinomycetospora chibensis]
MTATEHRPALGTFHHFSATVSDVEASAAWYERVFGMSRVPAPFPHYDDADSGYAIVLLDPATGIGIGLHHHRDQQDGPADERRCGLDHISFAVPTRADVDAWASWLDRLGIAHSGANDTDDPVPYTALVFRDPDNVQLEIFYMDTPD